MVALTEALFSLLLLTIREKAPLFSGRSSN